MDHEYCPWSTFDEANDRIEAGNRDICDNCNELQVQHEGDSWCQFCMEDEEA